MPPKLSGSELMHTDFTDSAAWEQASTEAQQENADGCCAYIEPVSDPAFGGLSQEAEEAAVPAGDDDGTVLFGIRASMPVHPVPLTAPTP